MNETTITTVEIKRIVLAFDENGRLTTISKENLKNIFDLRPIARLANSGELDNETWRDMVCSQYESTNG